MKKQFEYQIEEEIDNLPDVGKWPHRPIYFQSGRKTQAQYNNPNMLASNGTDDDDDVNFSPPLPLGEPVNFETDLFRGKILLRVRNIVDNVPSSHTEYFEEGRKRLKNIVVQGQFKQTGLKASDVWTGEVYEKPYVMPKLVAKIVVPFFQRLTPGLIMDFTSDGQHKVLVRMASGAQTLSVNQPGSEPDIAQNPDISEETTLLFGNNDHSCINNSQKRIKLLRKKKKASDYEYDPNLVYTFNFYDDIIDYQACSVHMGKFGKIPLEKGMNGNPFSIYALTTDGREIFHFNIFHEILVKYKEENQE